MTLGLPGVSLVMLPATWTVLTIPAAMITEFVTFAPILTVEMLLVDLTAAFTMDCLRLTVPSFVAERPELASVVPPETGAMAPRPRAARP